jgi:alpha-D-ribose 1-methylphosphonate 5-triphosphate diphosphatase PhnM
VGLAPGERADFVQFQFDGAQVEIAATWVSGCRVFGR